MVSEARERLLSTAGAIFYAEGIHAVGVDRIVADAKVTRATFYRHFPSKDELVVAYLRAADEHIRVAVDAGRTHNLPAADVLRGIGAAINGQICGPGFRGCAFLNAATEYPDPAHPVHQVVLGHRAWFLATVTELFQEEGPARHFIMLRDGAMAAGHLTDPVSTGQTFMDALEGLLRPTRDRDGHVGERVAT